MPIGSTEAIQAACALTPEKDTPSADRAVASVSLSAGVPASDSMRMRESSLSPRPFLFSSATAWAALDFSLALSVGIAAQIDRTGLLAQSLHKLYLCAVAGLPFAFFVMASARLSGLYRVNANHAGFIELLRILRAVAVAGFVIYGLQKLWGTAAALQNAQIASQSLMTGAAMLACRVVWRRRRDSLYRRDIALRNFLIVGADEVGRDVRLYLASLRHSGYRFQGFVSMSEPTDNQRAVSLDEIVGDIQNVLEVARAKFVDEIIFSRRPATPGVLSKVLRQARSMGISIRLIPSLTETLIDRTDVEYVGDLPTIAVYVARQRTLSLFFKRAFDLTFALCGGIVLLPVFLVIAIAIKLQSPGPVLYRSKRVGHKGRVFTCFKFRTMRKDADSMRDQLAHLNERDGVLFKIARDPRVTAVGAFLRKYSLDELPQLWNVVRGDMSLVGPRPPISSEVAQYGFDHLRRLDAVPGITGLWQVEARQDPSFDNYVSLDRAYVNHWSFALDLRILLRTIKAVIRGTGS